MSNHAIQKKYMNPYLAGFFLGLLIIAAFYFSGRGLGASGAIKSTVTAVVSTVAPEHANNSEFYQSYKGEGSSPLKSWLVFEMLGFIFGALISGMIANRIKLDVVKPPKVKLNTRLVMAGVGGIAAGIGATLGRGCTSGAGLTGMSTLSLAGFISFMAMFGGAFVFSFFLRRYWINK
ncbi:MAG: YeeE/YedE thiosulfate transporter family protein [Bacteroidales bacterium]